MSSPDEPTPEQPTRPEPRAGSGFPFDLGALGGLAGAAFGGGPLGDLESLLTNLAQQSAEQGGGGLPTEPAEVVGSAGGGAVRVHVTGELEFTAVHIDAAVVDPEDVSVLEDLVLAAVRDAAQQLRRAGEAALGQMMGDALSGLSGLFGSLSGSDEEENGEDDDEDGRPEIGASGDAAGNGGGAGPGGGAPNGPSSPAR